MEIAVLILKIVAAVFFAILFFKYVWIAIEAILRLAGSVSVIAGFVLLLMFISDQADLNSSIEHVHQVYVACMEVLSSM